MNPIDMVKCDAPAVFAAPKTGKRSLGAVLGRSGSTGDLTAYEGAAMQKRSTFGHLVPQVDQWRATFGQSPLATDGQAAVRG